MFYAEVPASDPKMQHQQHLREVVSSFPVSGTAQVPPVQRNLIIRLEQRTGMWNQNSNGTFTVGHSKQ